MAKMIYCNLCGKILDTNERFQAITREWDTRKRKTILDLCPKCKKEVEHVEVPPVKFKSHKKIKFTSILIRDVEKKSTKLMFDVLPEQLEYILSLEKPVDKLKLTKSDGSRYYTVAQVKKWMLLRRKNLIEAMYILYQRQEDDEKESRETKYANAVGFNKPDADFLSGMARIYEERGYKAYTTTQYKAIEKRVMKYVKQITLYINSEGLYLTGV